MIIRILLILGILTSGLVLKADEAINKAYFERGIETAKIVQEDSKKFMAHYSEQLQTLRNGINVGDTTEKAKEEEKLTRKLEYYTEQLRKPFQIPRINVAGVDLPTGAVGVLDGIGPYDSIADPPHYYQATASEIGDDGFTAEVNFGSEKKVYFQGFDKSKIAREKPIEITEVVVVVGPTNTPFGRCLKIRKLTDKELAEAQQYAEAKVYPNVREWAEDESQFKFKAEFIDLNGSTVTLKKVDGTEVKMQLSKLSKADRDWIKKHRKNGE